MGAWDKPYDYAKALYRYQSHYRRFKARVTTTGDHQPCPMCKGEGGHKEVILDDGSGPWFNCGLCEGLGETTHWLAMWWLRHLKMKKQEAQHANR